MQGSNVESERAPDNAGREPVDRAGWPNSGSRNLQVFLDYELRASARYRRFVTLVVFSSADGSVDYFDSLGAIIRGSDEFFDLDSTGAILMGETDSSDALVAVERFKSRCRDGMDLRFAMASYPSDGRAPAELLSAAYRRLDHARMSVAGAVVCSG